MDQSVEFFKPKTVLKGNNSGSPSPLKKKKKREVVDFTAREKITSKILGATFQACLHENNTL